MRNLVVYFTATGNTERLVKIISQRLEHQGETVQCRYIEVTTPPLRCTDLAEIDRLIICFPVLALQAPAFFKRFIRRLPVGINGKGQTIKAALIANAGGDDGGAAHSLSLSLSRRAYEIVLADQVLYPANWTQVGLVITDPPEIERQLAQGDQMAQTLCDYLVKDQPHIKKRTVSIRLFGGLLGFLFGLIGRRFLGKTYYADQSCNACGLCQRTCPAQTIVLKPGKTSRPYWRFNCQDCGRCINICPQYSINFSIGKSIVLMTLIIGLCVPGVWLSLFLAYNLWALPTPFAAVVATILILIFLIAAHLLVIGPIDFLLFRPLSRLRVIDRLMGLSPFKKVGRYRAPGFRPQA